MKRAVSIAQLTDAVAFDRHEMPMSTLIANAEWRFEAEWDGSRIGDIQMYKRTKEGDWVSYGSVPCVMVKGYRWADAEPEAEPRKTRKGGGEIKPFSEES